MPNLAASRFSDFKRSKQAVTERLGPGGPDHARQTPVAWENGPTDAKLILLGDTLRITVNERLIKAEVVWTSRGTCGVLYLDDHGHAASPSFIDAWLPREAKLEVPADSPRGNRTQPADGLVVDVQLETGHACRGIARWPSGGMPVVQLFFRPEC